MNFEKLIIQNFMSVRSAEIELDNQGLILVQGKNTDDPAFDSNGAGKSTIFEALTYVIFEKTVRGLKGEEIINNNVGKNCSIFLDLKDDNGVPYRLARYRKHNEHKNSSYVYRDGKNITPKSSKDTNKFIEDLLQIDFETFTNSILFGQGLVKMFSTASDADKKAILEKMLNMTVFKDCQDEAKEKLSEKNAELSKLDSDKVKTENVIQEVIAVVDSLKASEEEHATNTLAEIKRLTEELNDTEKRLAEESKDSSNSSERVNELNEKKQQVEEKLSKFSQYEKVRNEIAGNLQSLLRDKKRADNETDKLKEEIAKIKRGEGTDCPVCGQEITKETTGKALEHTTQKLRENLMEKQRIVEELTSEKGKLEKIDTFLKGKEQLQEQRDVILGELSEINALVNTKVRVKKDLENRVETTKQAISRLESQLEKTFKPMIQEKEKQLTELTEQLESISGKCSSLAMEIELIEFWVKAFGNSGIKSYLLDSVTPFLNKQANYYLSKLAGNTTEIEFSTQTRLRSGEVREKFEIRINNLVGGASYGANSTGERRRIDLAISLALQDLVATRSNGKINIRLYDEAFDGLDAVGCENVIQLLQELQQIVPSIFVITHNDHLKPYFDESLTVVKEGGMTTIQKEGANLGRKGICSET